MPSTIFTSSTTVLLPALLPIMSRLHDEHERHLHAAYFSPLSKLQC